MLDFIFMGFVSYEEWEASEKILIKNNCLQRDSNPKHFAPHDGALDHSATMTDDELYMKVLHIHDI